MFKELIDEEDIHHLLAHIYSIRKKSPKKESPAITQLIEEMMKIIASFRIANTIIQPKEAFQEMINALSDFLKNAIDNYKTNLFRPKNYIDALNNGWGKYSDYLLALTLKEIFLTEKYQKVLIISPPPGILRISNKNVHVRKLSF